MKQLFLLCYSLFYTSIAWIISNICVFIKKESDWFMIENISFSIFAGVSCSLIVFFFRNNNRRENKERK